MQRFAISTGRFVPVFLFLTLITVAACETPTEAGLEGSPLSLAQPRTMEAEGADDAIVIDADGRVMPYATAMETEVTTAPGAKRMATVITGKTTYASGNIRALRMNVRMDADGNLVGAGTATIMGHEIDFTPTCLKENSGFGTPFYGVNVEFAEPLPYYTTSYKYGTISVADGGKLSSLILANNAACRSSALLYPYEPVNGAINILFMN